MLSIQYTQIHTYLDYFARADARPLTRLLDATAAIRKKRLGKARPPIRFDTIR